MSDEQVNLRGWNEAMTREQYREMANELTIENAKLTEKINDLNETHYLIMTEQCASDEIHCGCVPFLRAEVEKLKAAGDALVEAAEDAWQLIMSVRNGRVGTVGAYQIYSPQISKLRADSLEKRLAEFIHLYAEATND